jgi:hypothetical protein
MSSLDSSNVDTKKVASCKVSFAMTSTGCFFMLSVLQFETGPSARYVPSKPKGSHELPCDCTHILPRQTRPPQTVTSHLSFLLSDARKAAQPRDSSRIIAWCDCDKPRLHLIPPTTNRQITTRLQPSLVVPLLPKATSISTPTTPHKHIDNGRSRISTAAQPAGSAGHDPHLAN